MKEEKAIYLDFISCDVKYKFSSGKLNNSVHFLLNFIDSNAFHSISFGKKKLEVMMLTPVLRLYMLSVYTKK